MRLSKYIVSEGDSSGHAEIAGWSVSGSKILRLFASLTWQGGEIVFEQ